MGLVAAGNHSFNQATGVVGRLKTRNVEAADDAEIVELATRLLSRIMDIDESQARKVYGILLDGPASVPHALRTPCESPRNPR
ncbi:hypothetical protein [Nocardia sp. NPDC005745]|uniref:hypothetical protein n=1 Tax=Nocardia sp. NPDC005745 TaxID=3157061 RepID=UPI0033C9DC84